MNKITLVRHEGGWKAFMDDDETMSGIGETPYKALDALATMIKFLG